MNALDRLAQHEQFMRTHHRAVARDLLPDLELIALEAVYRELPVADLAAIGTATAAIERIAADGS